MKDKDWSTYQNQTYNNNVSNLLLNFFKKYNVSNAVDLGCGSGNETVYMLKKGIKVIAIDRQLNKEYILNRINDFEKNNVRFIESDFINVDIPKTQLVASFFSIPFCNPNYFKILWDKIYNSLEDNGYFVGQLFGDRDSWNDNEDVNTFSMDEVKEYLKKYEILDFEEIEYTRESDNKKWHFYNIIAKKVIR